MKKLIALLLAVVMLLSMTACGGSAEPAEPVQTAPADTEPVLQVTEAPTEEPTVAPTEDPNAYTVYTLGENESYESVAWRHGFWEVDMTACVAEAERYGAKGGEATPLSLELSQNGFRMEVDYTGYDYVTNKVIPYGTVELIGAKGDGPADISGINSNDYMFNGSSYFEDQNGVTSEFGSFAGGYLLTDTYWYHNTDTKGKWQDLVYVVANYYVTTGNLYNTVYHVPAGAEDRGEPVLLYHIDSVDYTSPFYPEVQTLTYGDFTFEMSQFAIMCGDKRYVYDYRPGMSFCDWACSELNTDGWIPWYGEAVLSPDRSYVGNWSYLAMEEMMAFYGSGNVLVAEEYDGSINRFNNSATYVESSNVDLSGLDQNNGGSLTMIDGDQMQEFMDEHGFTSIDQVQDYVQQNGIGELTGTSIQPEPEDGNITMDDVVKNMGSSEELEIADEGNISVSVAHMVNAKTPLFTPGFRVISKEDGRVAYHSVELGGGFYLLDDILDIYMNGIADELIPHIKLYAFPESEEFMKTLEGHTILNAHTAPLKQGDPMLTIPEDAVCLTFQRVPDGQEAPNTPSSRIVPNGVMHNGMLHGNLNKDAVYARYVTKDDPNFAEGVNLVFAITFDDELVYWIHMGANFNETADVEYVSPEMRY